MEQAEKIRRTREAQYQKDKKVLTETELNDKYSKAKLARYAVYNKWQKQMSTKEK